MGFEQAYSRHLSGRDKEGGAEEPRKKLRKKRSIRFSNGGSWFRLSSKSAKSRFDVLPSENSAVQEQQPSYMKSTSCFNAKKETSHEEIDCDDVNSMVSSSCGSSDIVVVPSSEMSDDAAIPRNRSPSMVFSDASPLSLKETKLNDSESSYDSSDNGKSSNYAQSKSISLSRSSSKRGVRIFIKKNSFNPRRISTSTTLKNNSEMSEHVNVERATCSSVIKDSRFPHHVELEAGQAESEGTSFVRVCPYHHCSLNGHCHDPPLPKKPFLRRRRPSSLPQKAGKSVSVSGPEAKRSTDKKKGSKKHQMAASNADELLVHEASVLESEDHIDSGIVLDVSLDPETNNQEFQEAEKNSSKQDGKFPEATSELKEKGEVEKPKAPAIPFGSQKTQLSKGMWHLIHKHMVSGIPAEEETRPDQGTDERRQVEEEEMATTSCNVSLDLSDSDIGNSNQDNVNQDMEIRKLFAIKLVREAVEKILLPEVQDQLSETQSITSDSVEGQELTKKNHQEAPDEGFIPEGNTTEEKKKPVTLWGKKSDKKSPSNWSNLKKWVLLQRFVKELEKVKKINYRKPRELQPETEPSADNKVSLRRQTVDEKKKGEEWMLDYALQQVVSQLAPTQRRKVSLLVKAFETVVPPQEDGVQTTAKTNVTVMQEDRDLKADNLSLKPDDLESSACRDHSDTGNHQTPDLLKSDDPRNAYSTNVASGKSSGKVNDKELSSFKAENFNVTSESTIINEDINVATNWSYEFPAALADIVANSEADQGLTSKDENIPEGSVPSTKEVGKIEETPTMENSVHSILEQEGSTWKDTKSESMAEPGGVFQVIPPQITKTNSGENEVLQSPLDKQNYLGMWHLVCQHVVSSVATKLVLDGDDEETEEANKKSSAHAAMHHKAEFSRSQVLKLVKEAVQEILSPEIQDESSDTLSTSSEILPDPKLSEKDDEEGAKQGRSYSDELTKQNTGDIDKSKEDLSRGEEKELETDVITAHHSKDIESIDRSITDSPKPKNWRKLKKLLLLKRSIKAMEKSRKLKFATQQLLPLPSDQGPEKVDLRHQMVDERRKAEQWMLDYAVQHIVTKLTPARKKRVAMLVEAFEAVVPLPEM